MVKIDYHYVPDQITSQWAGDEGKFTVFAADRGILEDNNIRDAFAEDIKKDKKDFRDVLKEKNLTALLFKLQKGDGNLTEDENFWAHEIFVLQYFLNPTGWYRMYEYWKELENTESGPVPSISVERSVSDILSLYYRAMFETVYFMDLEVSLVFVPEGSSFVLPANPMYISNPAFGYSSVSNNCPYVDNGVLLFMPLSPTLALTAYDGFVYKPKKTNGRVVLANEDVDEYNRLVFSMANKVVVAPDALDVEYLKNIAGKARNGIEHYTPSVFQIRARSVEVEGSVVREYCDLLTEYDTRLLSEKGSADISDEEYSIRYSEAMKVVRELRKNR